MVTLVNRAKVSTSTTGTGTLTLGAAADGYQTFGAAGVTDGGVVRYVIEDGSNWEIGTGTYTASGTTLSRIVSESSNADAAINLSGTATVFVGATAEDLAPIRTPTVISPNGATDVVRATLTASAYAPLYSADVRSVREFQLTTFADTGYATPVFTASVNADTVAVTPDLGLVTQYRWRCRDVAVSGATSAYSTDAVFTTLNFTVNAPTLTVQGSPTEVPETPTLTTGAFATTPTGEDTHASTNWIVRLAADDTIVYQSLADTVNLLSIVVPEGNLLVDTQYKFQVQHVGTTYGASAVTEVVATTLDAFEPAIGDAFGGGFFTGEIWINGGELYRLVVAPKASGEGESVAFKTTQTASPAATQTLNNGPAATAAMVSAGSHPAAAFCAGLTIGGFSDWYLPARDELELAYRNLKFTTAANSTSVKNLSAIAYPEGNDVSGDTMGRNRNSNPTGAAYTSGDPTQTSVTAFVTGGTEAFAEENYHSSSEFSDDRAWRDYFGSGAQLNNTTKDSTLNVRAFRRELVSPNIGDFIYGGYFGGTIYEGGVPYYLIVSPKASGENASVAFKTTQTASPAATQTLNNGPAATAAMVSAGDHPAAAFCAGLTINGFSDWYLPARDELEILYRTLKPTTTGSSTIARSLSAITYPEGNDVSGDTMGFNRNSVNINTGYTSTIPAQTGLALFQEGGAEALVASSHWSSSELSDINAWRQNPFSGFQGGNFKDSLGYARAIRRVAV